MRIRYRMLALLLVGLPLLSRGEVLKKGDRFPAVTGIATGRVTLVDFWASWCGPCKASFPAMDRLQEKFGPRGFQIVAVSVDDDESAMRAFLEEHPVTFRVLHDEDHRLVSLVDIPAMPTSFLLDRSGRVLSVHEGFRPESTEEELAGEIGQALKGAKP